MKDVENQRIKVQTGRVGRHPRSLAATQQPRRRYPWSMPMHRTSIAACVLMSLPALAQTSFTVSFDKSVRDQAATGRIVVYLVKDGSQVSATEAPSSGPFWDDPQPLYGVDVTSLSPGTTVKVDDSATSFPCKLSALPQARYRVQAVLDLHHDNSDWKREPGNLYSDTKTVTIGATDGPTVVELTLNHAVGPRPLPTVAGVEWFEVRSALLSNFHKRDIMLRAGVVLPVGYEAAVDQRYAAIYEVPGYGGDHRGAARQAGAYRSAPPASPTGILARNCFWIVLDPESGNGHTLFADSANNGPCGEALVKELIPALEAKYRLRSDPKARLLRGHSSGGWSTLWLALRYPETFGATWSTSPDPVDFRKFQTPDIYADANMYGAPAQADSSRLTPHPSYRVGNEPKMSIAQENQMEEVLGPDNTSAQQWDSWQAVWGPRNGRGHPVALYDPQTGVLDHALAEKYRPYDIADLVRREPGQYGLLLHQRCRVVVGDLDSYYLNQAVALLKAESDKLNFITYPEGRNGYIKILPGLDHGSVFASTELRGIPQEMLDHLTRNGFIIAPKP